MKSKRLFFSVNCFVSCILIIGYFFHTRLQEENQKPSANLNTFNLTNEHPDEPQQTIKVNQQVAESAEINRTFLKGESDKTHIPIQLGGYHPLLLAKQILPEPNLLWNWSSTQLAHVGVRDYKTIGIVSKVEKSFRSRYNTNVTDPSTQAKAVKEFYAELSPLLGDVRAAMYILVCFPANWLNSVKL